MREDFVVLTTPIGASCFYRERDHSYWLSAEPARKRDPLGEWKGKGRLNGISTIAKAADYGSNGLMKWAARETMRGVAQLAGFDLHDELATAEGIEQALERFGLSYEAERERKQERGTNVHKHALHALSRGEPVPDYGALTEEERAYANGVAKFWFDHHPAAVYAEAAVLDLDKQVAGRLDFLGSFGQRCGVESCACRMLSMGRNSKKPSVVVLDAKTKGDSGYIGAADHVQVAGYRYGARKSGMGATDGGLLLVVDGEGDYRLVEVQAVREDFMATYELYHRVKVINAAAREAAKVAA